MIHLTDRAAAGFVVVIVLGLMIVVVGAMIVAYIVLRG